MIVKFQTTVEEHYQLHGPLTKLLQCCQHRETKENILHLSRYIKRSSVPRIYQTKELKKIFHAVPLSYPTLILTYGETKSICRFAKNKRTIEHDIARAIRSESPIMIAIWSRHGRTANKLSAFTERFSKINEQDIVTDHSIVYRYLRHAISTLGGL